jgi:hypothetical protein
MKARANFEHVGSTASIVALGNLTNRAVNGALVVVGSHPSGASTPTHPQHASLVVDITNAGHAGRSRARWQVLLTGLIPPIAAGTLAWVNGFDGLYGQDAFAYYRYAVVALREQLYPPPPFFWPPGYPLLILLTTILVGITPLAGQLISLICGGLTAVFTALLTHEVLVSDDTNTGVASLVAGLAMGFTGQLWQSSAVIMADTPSLAAATLGMWALSCWTRLTRDDATSPRAVYWLILASGALAYAAITRWIYSVVALVAALWALVSLYRVYQQSWRRAARYSLLAAIPAVLILGPVLIPALTRPPGAAITFGGNFRYPFGSWNPTNAFRRDFVNVDGFHRYALPNALYYGSLPARAFYFAPVLAAFIVTGLGGALRQGAAGRVIPLMGWVIAMYVLLVGGPQQNVRFGLSYMPPLAVLIGAGAAAFWQRLGLPRDIPRTNEHEASPLSKHTLAFVIVICTGLAWAGISGVRWTQGFIVRQHESLATVRWVEGHVLPDAQVIAFGLTLTMQHYTEVETHEIFSLTPEELATIIGDHDRPTYLLLDVGQVETQWREQSPAIHYRWLRDGVGLTRIEQRGAFTLFRVNAP